MKLKIRLIFFVFFISIAMATFGQDTVVVAKQKPKGAPVFYKSDTLFYLYSYDGSFSPSERAFIVGKRISDLLENPQFKHDSLYIDTTNNSAKIKWKDNDVVNFTGEDSEEAGIERLKLTYKNYRILKAYFKQELNRSTIVSVLTDIGLVILIIGAIILLVFLLNKLYKLVLKIVDKKKEKFVKGIHFKNYEVVSKDTAIKFTLRIIKLSKWVFLVLIVYLGLPLLFSVFPQTKNLAEKLFSYIASPIKSMLMGFVNFVPNLLTIIVIIVIIRLLVRFLKTLTENIEQDKINIPGFYNDWARPTFAIVRFLIYVFGFIAIFPYLPGSSSPIFQGVSVFLGLLISLGSSSAISNAVAGLVITYMRPFKIGDRVQIGDAIGDVVEKTMLVTRLKTIKNEFVTIPNSAILNGQTINFSSSNKDVHLIIYSTVTIGYDVPWRETHELLINAAKETAGVLKNPQPFVLQTSLDDFYPSYQINVYIGNANQMNYIKSELLQNIQDSFNQAGVEILSPHYRAERDGNPSTIPLEYTKK